MTKASIRNPLKDHKDIINYCYFLTEHSLACVQKMYLDFSNNITCLNQTMLVVYRN